MDLLAADRVPPRRWAGSRSSCHFASRSRASGRVNKSYALPPGIKDGDAHRRQTDTGLESVQMVVGTNAAPNASMPALYRKRPAAVARLGSASPGASSRPSSARSSAPFDQPSPLDARRGSPSSSASSSPSPGRGPPQGWDQTALGSPMRTLLLTMPPPVAGDNADPAARAKQPHAEFYTWENLPPQSLVASCISEFYSGRGIAKILCPIPQSEVSEMFQSIYASSSGSGPGSRQVPRATNNHRLCQVLLLAATGSQYLEDAVPEEARSALFTSGKWYLDMAFGRDAHDLQRLRANVLTGLFLMFEKSIGAVEYLNRAIAISRARGLHRDSPAAAVEAWAHPRGGDAAGPSRSAALRDSTNDAADNWAHWKSIWRSLVFLDGWMFATVGSAPQTHKPSDAVSEDGRLHPAEGAANPCGSDLDFDLHAQLEQLGLLMSAITADVLAPARVPLATVKVYSDHLKAWHANLPSSLTLSTAIRESYESPRKNSTLLIHCAYLVSITQLTRRTLVERVTAPAAPMTGDEFSKICVSAARQLATVVGMLRAENRLTRRCWLIIQSAYTAGIVICLDVARSRGRPMLESAFHESLDLVAKCMHALQHCATPDAVAARYLAVLRPIYLTLCTPDTAAARRARMFRDPFAAGQIGEPDVRETYPSNEAMLGHIVELMAPCSGAQAAMPPDFTIAGSPPEHRRAAHQQPPAPHPSGHVPPSLARARQDAAPRSEGPNSGSPRQSGKAHPWTKEEYEAFFRRVT